MPDGWPAGGAVSTESDECRHFQADDGEWVARRVGESGYGTGCMGKAALDALRFARVDSPTDAVREILAPRHDLSLYFDDELRGLLARALPVLDEGREPGSERPV